eukprot:1158183-Pelagomonas_calceolata.AAC.1
MSKAQSNCLDPPQPCQERNSPFAGFPRLQNTLALCGVPRWAEVPAAAAPAAAVAGWHCHVWMTEGRWPVEL